MTAIFRGACLALAQLAAFAGAGLSQISRKALPVMPDKAAPSESLAPDRLDTGEFAKNMLTVGIKSQKLVLDFMARMASRKEAGPIDPLNITGAMLALRSEERRVGKECR